MLEFNPGSELITAAQQGKKKDIKNILDKFGAKISNNDKVKALFNAVSNHNNECFLALLNHSQITAKHRLEALIEISRRAGEDEREYILTLLSHSRSAISNADITSVLHSAMTFAGAIGYDNAVTVSTLLSHAGEEILDGNLYASFLSLYPEYQPKMIKVVEDFAFKALKAKAYEEEMLKRSLPDVLIPMVQDYNRYKLLNKFLKPGKAHEAIYAGKKQAAEEIAQEEEAAAAAAVFAGVDPHLPNVLSALVVEYSKTISQEPTQEPEGKKEKQKKQLAAL